MNLLPRLYVNNPTTWPQSRTVVMLLPVFLCALICALVNAPLTHAQQSDADPTLLSLLKRAATDADSFTDQYDAEVWLMTKEPALAPLISDPETRVNLLTLIHSEATRAGLSPEIVLALIEVESGFDRYAVSAAGAQGIMQVMPFWKHEIGRPEDNLINTQTNLRYGCTILKYYLDREKGRLADALARYNGSYGQYWYAERVLDAWARRWR